MDYSPVKKKKRKKKNQQLTTAFECVSASGERAHLSDAQAAEMDVSSGTLDAYVDAFGLDDKACWYARQAFISSEPGKCHCCRFATYE